MCWTFLGSLSYNGFGKTQGRHSVCCAPRTWSGESVAREDPSDWREIAAPSNRRGPHLSIVCEDGCDGGTTRTEEWSRPDRTPLRGGPGARSPRTEVLMARIGVGGWARVAGLI